VPEERCDGLVSATRAASGLTRARLAWLQATHRRAWAAAIWLCLAVAAGLPVLLLLVGGTAVDVGLAQTLAGTGGFSVRQGVADADAMNALDRQVDARVVARTGSTLVPLGDIVTAGAVHIVTDGGLPVSGPLASTTLTAVYDAHLAAHAAAVAGELPPDGLGAGDTAVTMARSAADHLGLRLSDHVCADLSATGTESRWCARIVGLWQPLSQDDPYWAGTAPGVTLSMGRFDLFQLAALRRPERPVALLRYRVGPDTVSPAAAVALAGAVDALAADLRAPGRQVDARLAGGLRTFDRARRQAAAAVQALAAALAVVGLAAVGLAASRLLDAQSRELALLRARGWPAVRTWAVAFLGLLGLAVSAVPAGLALCALGDAALGAANLGLTARVVHAGDLPGIAAFVAADAAVGALLLAVLAARAVWAAPAPRAGPGAAAGWLAAGGVAASLAAGGAGAVALAVSLVAGVPAAAGGGAALLAAAAVGLWPQATWVPWRGSVHGDLAGLQLERRRGQHAWAAFVLTLATAGAVLAALALSSDAGGPPALHLGVAAGLGAGAVGGMLLALTAAGLHFRSMARRRLVEYAGLIAHGLPPAHVARSVAAEQAAMGGLSLLTGTVLGAVMALAVLPVPPPAGILTSLAALACLVVAGLIVGWLSRRLPAQAGAPWSLRPG
jgi:hypothetical protein